MQLHRIGDGLVRECQHHQVLFHESDVSFREIDFSVRVLKRSDGSRRRRRIPLPRHGTKGVDPLELR
jgi:hypothetical protein